VANVQSANDQHAIALGQALHKFRLSARDLDAEPLRVLLPFAIRPQAHLVDGDRKLHKLGAFLREAHLGFSAQVAQQRHSQHLLL